MNLDQFTARVAAEQRGEIAVVEREGAYALDEHAHPFHAYALVTRGEITIEAGGHETRYAEGDVFDLPANTPHRERTGPEGVTYRVARKPVDAA